MIFEWNKFHSHFGMYIPHVPMTLMSLVGSKWMWEMMSTPASQRQWPFWERPRRNQFKQKQSLLTLDLQASSFIKCDWLIFLGPSFALSVSEIWYVNANNVIMRLKPTQTHTATLFSQGFWVTIVYYFCCLKCCIPSCVRSHVLALLEMCFSHCRLFFFSYLILL